MAFPTFANFKPMSSNTPYRHLGRLGEIVFRARKLLENRTDDQVETIADVIDSLAEDYFREAQETAIQKLVEEGHQDWLEADWDGNFYDLKDDHEWLRDWPTREDTSDVEVLQYIGGGVSGVFDDGMPDAMEHEYFAVVALVAVGKVINNLEYRWDQDKRCFEELDWRDSADPARLRYAADKLCSAMEALVVGESTKLLNYVHKSYEKLLDDAKAHAPDLERQRMEAEEKTAADARKFEKMAADAVKAESRKNGKRGHGDLEAHKALVLEDWAKNPKAHKSLNDASLYYRDWLFDVHGVEPFRNKKNGQTKYMPDTIRKWISDYSRAQGIKAPRKNGVDR